MSYSVAQPGVPQPGAPKPRPGVVSTASSLLYLSSVLLIVQATLGFLSIGPIKQVVDDFYADRNPDEAAAANVGFTIGIIATGVIYVLIAVALVVLGLLVGKGKNPARIVTWILAGLGVLCIGCGVVSGAVTGSMSGLGGNADTEALTRQIEDVVPAWQTTVGTVLQILSLIILVVVIILLALPASNDFFRKEQEVWVPPTSWPNDPTGGQPPYLPPAPGTPPPPYNPGPPPPTQ